MNISNNAPIGVIDSGVGGLTVVKEMMSFLPEEKIIYIGDDARCPYGPRSVEEVKRFTMEMALALSDMGIKMLVVACNTATAVALDDLRNRFPFPVLGVIEPGARAASQVSPTRRIVVLGTVGTIKSRAYEHAISAISAETVVYPLACPEFVPLVESGQYKQTDIRPIMKKTLEPIAHLDFDTAILGCTHYPLLHNHIQEQLPSGVTIVSSANETVKDVKRTLSELGIANNLVEHKKPIFYTTGGLGEFIEITSDWLKIENPDVRHLIL
ncbi:glutamate racemase [Sporosarcina thermotolerans]|uniref:Glutamate racemase n=2 Tax=Sporosarcina thermotolerans TaxID=633404 RepID=A0AAW9ADJ8_9BACL|nr:glutamate racemase [Sporosarcina thermotolerans]MDW0118135.1 glutamate racemase [Sporosarcina thermotolerans]